MPLFAPFTPTCYTADNVEDHKTAICNYTKKKPLDGARCKKPDQDYYFF